MFYVPLAAASFAWLNGGAGVHLTSAGLGGGILLGAALAGITWVLGPFWPFRDMEEVLSTFIGPLSAPALFALALASAIGEELLFRGILQPWWGLVPTALAFGAVHVPHERRLWPWPFFAFGMGLLFGWLTVYSGELGPAIGAHFAVNAINLGRVARPA